jgi:hypothetical protein
MNTTDHASQSATSFTVVHIPSGLPTLPSIQFNPFERVARLAQELDQPETKESCRLFIVENARAKIIFLLGERFDIDPQFFADHLKNEPWYQIANIADQLPTLPASQRLHDFLQLRCIEPRQLSNCQYSFHGSQPFFVEIQLRGNAEDDESVISDAKSFMKPDETTTRISRKSGKLTPRIRKGREFEPLLCTRQVITVWFNKSEVGSKGWTSICLFQESVVASTDNK